MEMAHTSPLIIIATICVFCVAGSLIDIFVPPHWQGLNVVRGNTAFPGQFPWQVWIECIRGKYASTGCGGSLISKRHILTAAHCVEKVLLCRVSLGMTSLQERGISFYQYPSTIVIHEEYGKPKYLHDIAIIKLKTETFLIGNIEPIRLALRHQNSNSLSGKTAVISGWGKTKDGEIEVHRFLQYGDVTIMDVMFCNKYYKKHFGVEIGDGHICTEDLVSNVCNGDSGGPLSFLEEDYSWRLIGVVSLGITPCEEGTPSVFTAVSKYLPWIDRVTEYTIPNIDSISAKNTAN